MSEDVALWERQAWDTNASYKAFKYYLDVGDGAGRLLRAYRQHRAEKGAKSVPKAVSGTWKDWSRGANPTTSQLIQGAVTWEHRAKSYDTHLARLELEALAKERAQNKAQRIKMIRGVQNTALVLLSQVIATPQKTADGRIIYPEIPSLADLTRIIKIANQEARIEFGDLPEQKIQHSTKDGRPLQTIEQNVQVGYDFSNYDDDDLKHLIRRMESRRRRAVSGSTDGGGGTEEDPDTGTADTG